MATSNYLNVAARTGRPGYNYGEAFDSFVSMAAPLVSMIENNRTREQQWRLAQTEENISRQERAYGERIADNQRVLDQLRLDTAARNQEWRQYLELQTHLGDMELKRQAAEQQSAQFRMQREAFDISIREQAAGKEWSASFMAGLGTFQQDPLWGVSKMEAVFSSPLTKSVNPTLVAQSYEKYNQLLHSTPANDYLTGVSGTLADVIRSARGAQKSEDAAKALRTLSEISPSIMTDPELQAKFINPKFRPFVAGYLADAAATIPDWKTYQNLNSKLEEATSKLLDLQIKQKSRGLTPESDVEAKDLRNQISVIKSQLSGGMGDTIGLRGDPVNWLSSPTLDPGVFIKALQPEINKAIAAMPVNDPRRKTLVDFKSNSTDIATHLLGWAATLRSISTDKLRPDNTLVLDKNTGSLLSKAYFKGKDSESDVLGSLSELNSALSVLGYDPLTPDQIVPKSTLVAITKGLRSFADDYVAKKVTIDTSGIAAEDAISLLTLLSKYNSNVISVVNGGYDTKVKDTMSALLKNPSMESEAERIMEPWYKHPLEDVAPDVDLFLRLGPVGVVKEATRLYGAANKVPILLEATRGFGANAVAAKKRNDIEAARMWGRKVSESIDVLNKLRAVNKDMPAWTTSDFVVDPRLLPKRDRMTDAQWKIIMGLKDDSDLTGNPSGYSGTIPEGTKLIPNVSNIPITKDAFAKMIRPALIAKMGESAKETDIQHQIDLNWDKY